MKGNRKRITAILGVLVVALGLSVGVAAAATLTADFSATPSDPYVGESVTLNASSSVGDNITSYEWDVNNDGSYEYSGSVLEYPFSEAGDHTVVLKVTDGTGATDTFTQTISVHEQKTYNVTASATDAGNASSIQVSVDGVSQSHDLIVNGDFETQLEEGSVIAFDYVNDSATVVTSDNTTVGEGNVTLSIDDASVSYTETQVDTTGTATTDDSGLVDSILTEVGVDLIALFILAVIGLKTVRGD